MTDQPRAAISLIGDLSCFDGKYRYRCEKAHNVVASVPFMDTCPAEIGDRVCGADIDHRIVDYRGEGEFQ